MKSLLFVGLMCCASAVFSGEMIISPQEWQFWGKAPAGVSPIVTEQVYSAVSTSRNVLLTVKELDSFEAEENPLMTFTITLPENSRTMFHCYWATQSEPRMHENRSFHQVLFGTGKPQLCTVNLAGHPEYKGSIRALRIDPAALRGEAIPFSLGDVVIGDDLQGFPLHPVSWGKPLQVRNYSVEGDCIRLELNGKLPQLIARLPLPFEAGRYKKFSFELKLPEGSNPVGKLYWSAGKAPFSEARSIHWKTVADGEFHKIELDLSSNPEWHGGIDALRLDLIRGKVFAAGTVEFRNAGFSR